VSGLVLAAAAAVAVAVFLRRAAPRVGLLRAARPSEPMADPGGRIRRELVHVLGQGKLFQRLLPGLMHALIFWGFVVLLPTIAEAAISIVDREASLPLLGEAPWFLLLADVFATLVVVGVGIALWIRKVLRPDRFRGSHMGEADRILLVILAIVTTLLLWNAARIALGLHAHPASMPVSNRLSELFAGGRETEAAERLLVWSHVLLVLGFLAYLPGSKHLHILTAVPNVYLAKTGPSGRLAPLRIDLDAPEGELRLGAAVASDLSRKQVLDSLSCTECGRCQEVCPAWATGKPLSPKLLIMDLRDHMIGEAPLILASDDEGAGAVELQPLVPNAVTDEVVWDCVTCGACVRECPVDIEHIDTIVDLRRNLVMAESRFPPEAAAMLRGIEGSENPWGQPAFGRTTWTEGLEVRVLAPGEPAPEYLYWVGCAGAFDERARASTRSVARLLTAAGVEWAILGPAERCTGDPARRMGHEYLFQMLAEQNVQTLNDARVTKIVASCPHCFNTLANEYGDYDGIYEVLHHTELLSELVRDGRLRPSKASGTATFHDPCYLGRHNGVFDAPRTVLGAAVESTMEMPRSHERSFCCGAGGARMWMEEARGTPINAERFREASATGAETVGVGCPYCLIMLDDAAKAQGSDVRIADVAALLAEATLREP
jgi:Fe-S oxidoreductase/nitrate reductase gamma subunit